MTSNGTCWHAHASKLRPNDGLKTTSSFFLNMHLVGSRTRPTAETAKRLFSKMHRRIAGAALRFG